MPRTSRRRFLKTMGAGTLSLAIPARLPASSSAAGRPIRRMPNVILIITDDQGYGDFSCHGNPELRTPHLDHLHGQSVRMTDFHVDPTCSPTRASLLTGRYSSRTGVWHTIMGRSQIRRDEITMADVFSRNGYRTGIFGKWHLGDNYPFRAQEHGFQESVVIGGGAIGNAPDYWDNDYFDDTYFRNGVWQKYDGYCTDVFFDQAMRFISADKDRPFFVYLPTNTPHWPHHVADKYSRPYLDRGIPERRATFYGMIANIDDNVGRLTKFLQDENLEANTIFVYMTDNGTSFGAAYDKEGKLSEGFNGMMRGQKGSIYDGGHHVPCFLRWPAGGLGGGRNVPELSAHIDMLPTLIDLCGLKGPENVRMDGASLRPLLEKRAADWKERILFVHNQRVDFPIKGKDWAAMTSRWRLVNGRELYDMSLDPGQKTDMAAAHAGVVRELQEAYARWWDDISSRFDEFTHIIVGSDKENPVKLTSHDIHGQVGWDHSHVKRNSRCDGFWAIEIERDGEYLISLRRFPQEAGIPLSEAPEGAEPMRVTHGRLKVAEHDLSRRIQPGDMSVDFRVNLRRGQTRLQGWLVDGIENGQTNAAFYVYIKRL